MEISLLHPLIEVTRKAAIAAAKRTGHGDRKGADYAAVEAMRSALGTMDIRGRVVIGEGERDEAPMLFIGEEVGNGNGPEVDIAVDPLEGTNMCATASPGSLAVMAVTPRGGLFHAPDIYMDKLVTGPLGKGAMSLENSPRENLLSLADQLQKPLNDLTITVLERDRHKELIQAIRDAGARVKLIGDGDLGAAILACQGEGSDAVMGVGGAPEGVLTAAAMRCLGGEILGRMAAFHDQKEEWKRMANMGITDPLRCRNEGDLASGEEILFLATGVTGGDLLEGVLIEEGRVYTQTLVLSLRQGRQLLLDQWAPLGD